MPLKKQEIRDCIDWLKNYCTQQNIIQMALKDLKPAPHGTTKKFLMRKFFKEMWREDFESGHLSIDTSFKLWREKKLQSWNDDLYEVRLGENFGILTNNSGCFQLYFFDDNEILIDTWKHELTMLSTDPLIISNLFGAKCIFTKNKRLRLILDGDDGWG
jgi:hypothetical protein